MKTLYPNEDKILEDYRDEGDNFSLPDWVDAAEPDAVTQTYRLAAAARLQMGKHDPRFLDMSNKEFLGCILEPSSGIKIWGFNLKNLVPAGIRNIIGHLVPTGIRSRQELEAKLSELKQESEAIEKHSMPELSAARAGINMDSVVRLPFTMGRYSKEDLLRLAEEDSTAWHVPRKMMIDRFREIYKEEIRLANTLFPNGDDGYQRFLHTVIAVNNREIRDGTINRGAEFHDEVKRELQEQHIAMVRAESERRDTQVAVQRKAEVDKLAERGRIEAARRQAERDKAAQMAALQTPPVILQQPVAPGGVQIADANAAVMAEINAMRERILQLTNAINAANGGQAVAAANQPADVSGQNSRYAVTDLGNTDTRNFSPSDVPRAPVAPQVS